MDLNHCLGPPPTQAQAAGCLDQIKIIAPIKFLLEVFAPGDSYRVIISLSKWPNNLNRCLHRLHPTSSYNIQILMHISVNKANILHQLGPLKLYKWHHIDCSFVFFVLSCVGTIVRDHASRPLEQLLAIFDVGH